VPKKLVFLVSLFIPCLLIWTGLQLNAQTTAKDSLVKPTDARFNLSNLRQKWIKIGLGTDTITLDTLSVFPDTFALFYPNGQPFTDTAAYKLYPAQAKIIFRHSILSTAAASTPPPDSLMARYRVMPFYLAQTFRHKNKQLNTPFGELPYTGNAYQLKPTTATSLFDFGGLNYNGSLTRGIAIGNNQDLSVNSNFNLQIAGKLPGDISILAALNDNNLPIQPEGNTQQLQEFDKIYIELKKQNHSLLLGDFSLANPANGYFMRVQRNLLGAKYQTNFNINKQAEKQRQQQLTFGAAAAIAKGAYQRQTLTPVEGNQGPYRLVGANGENFIVVLSGSERVYVDGRLLTRGATNDYIIDYNTAELGFTPKMPITKDVRLVVEFEYTDRTYLRPALLTHAQWQQGKTQIRIAHFYETDSKNQPVSDYTLSDAQKNALKNAGDNPLSAIVSGIDSVGYSPQSLVPLYALKDTTVGTHFYPDVLVQRNDTTASYAVRFSYVGQGFGDYIPQTENLNGRAFKWVSPDTVTQQKTGSYAPVQQLITPKQRQLLTLGAQTQIAKNGIVNAELALSQRDANTFSEKDDADNLGLAAALTWQNSWALSNRLHFEQQLRYEFANKQFIPVEPYRPVEFARNWNLPATSSVITGSSGIGGGLPAYGQHLAAIKMGIKGANGLNTTYDLSWLATTDTTYRGWQHDLQNQTSLGKGWLFKIGGTWLQTKQGKGSSSSSFIRPVSSLEKKLSKGRLRGFTFAIATQAEKNARWLLDSLTPQSFAWYDWKLMATNSDTSQKALRLSFVRRIDFGLKNQTYRMASQSQTLDIGGTWAGNKKQQQWAWQLNWRRLAITDSVLIAANNKPANNLLGSLTHQGGWWRGLLRSTTQYEIGSGQEQKTEYYYQPATNGPGAYIWKDYNTDGLQQTGEFEYDPQGAALSDTTTYNRLLLPTGDYLRTNNALLSQTLYLTPKLGLNTTSISGRKNNWRSILALVSTQHTISLMRKVATTQQARWLAWLPFGRDTLLQTISENSTWQNTLYLNRSNPAWELMLQSINIATTANLVSGADRRTRNEYLAQWRQGLGRRFTAILKYGRGNTTSASMAFANRNYHLQNQQIEPQLTAIISNKQRFILSYRYKHAFNKPNNPPANPPETTREHRLTAEHTLAAVGQNSINSRLSWVNIAYLGPTNTPAAFALLEGLQPGQNWLWTLNYGTRLPGNLQLNLQYEGRKSENSRVAHVGRMSLTALF
jgi:hypothetical protein